mgnify:CR=1 FL=1
MSSINKELRTIFIHVPKVAGGSLSNFDWNRGNGHKTFTDFEAELGNLEIEKYFVWAFVRNPWDRIVSAYEDCPEIFPHAPSFESFIKQIYYNRHELNGIRSLRFSSLPRFGFPFGRMHFQPMSLLLSDKFGTIRADWVGKYETLNGDFERLQLKLGVKPEILPHHNQRKKKKDRRTSFYIDLYTQELSEMVGEIYAKDIQAFCYEPPRLN